MGDERVAALLRELFPLGFCVDRSLRFVHVGAALAALLPEAVPGALLTEAFTLTRPRVALSAEALDRLHNVTLLLRARRGSLIWRGQRTLDGDWIHFAGGPQVSSFEELEGAGLAMQHFPPHDARLDLLVLIAARDAALADARALAAQLEAQNADVTARSDALQSEFLRQEQVASLGRLVAGIAHEVNTPLGIGVTGTSLAQEVLAGLTEQLKGGLLRRQELERSLLRLEQSLDLTARNLARAAELMQQFKQVAVDQSSAALREVVLHDYIQKVIDSLRPLLRGRAIETEMRCDAPLTALLAPGALAQIVTNLLQNAVLHAFPEGRGGRVTFVVRSVDAERAEVLCEDNGVGMGADVLLRAFEPFYTTRRGEGGSGLGLFVMRNLAIDTLGGDIRASSTVGEGSRFVLSFPLRPPAPRDR